MKKEEAYMSERVSILTRILKGVLAAALVSLMLMMLLALIVVYAQPGDSLIAAINQVIKLASLLLGVLVCVRPGGRRGFLLGAAVGLCYMALGYGLYCLLDDTMLTFSMLALEFSMGAVLGALAGALVANLPARRRRAS